MTAGTEQLHDNPHNDNDELAGSEIAAGNDWDGLTDRGQPAGLGDSFGTAAGCDICDGGLDADDRGADVKTPGDLDGGQMLTANPRAGSGQIPAQIPVQIPTLKTNDLAQIPADDFDLAGIWENESEPQIPTDDPWAELWRAEKDGRGNYRFALRFVKRRIYEKGGPLTPAVERWLEASRRGRGRHDASRNDADRLRGFAEHLAANRGNAATRGNGRSGATDSPGPGAWSAQRSDLSGVPGLAGDDLPDLLKSDRVM